MDPWVLEKQARDSGRGWQLPSKAMGELTTSSDTGPLLSTNSGAADGRTSWQLRGQDASTGYRQLAQDMQGRAGQGCMSRNAERQATESLRKRTAPGGGGGGDADRHATGRCPSAGLSGWQNALSGRVCLASGGGGRPDEPCHSPSNLRASSMNPAIGPRRHWPPPPTKAVYAHEQALPVARQASRLSSRRQGSRPLLGR
jgi:hypothetical protein